MDLPLIAQLAAYLFWVIAYVLMIRIGFKQETYAMPFFALSFNFPWEIEATFSSFVDSGISLQTTLANVFWTILDVFIVITYFKFGFKYFYSGLKRWHFYTWSVLQFALSTIILYLFAYEFGGFEGYYFSGIGKGGMYYTGILMCNIISFTYLHMIVTRHNLEGQTLGIWFFRMMGTFATGLYYGYFNFSVFALGILLMCTFLDFIYLYIFLLKKKQLEGKLNPSI